MSSLGGSGVARFRPGDLVLLRDAAGNIRFGRVDVVMVGLRRAFPRPPSANYYVTYDVDELAESEGDSSSTSTAASDADALREPLGEWHSRGQLVLRPPRPVPVPSWFDQTRGFEGEGPGAACFRRRDLALLLTTAMSFRPGDLALLRDAGGNIRLGRVDVVLVGLRRAIDGESHLPCDSVAGAHKARCEQWRADFVGVANKGAAGLFPRFQETAEATKAPEWARPIRHTIGGNSLGRSQSESVPQGTQLCTPFPDDKPLGEIVPVLACVATLARHAVGGASAVARAKLAAVCSPTPTWYGWRGCLAARDLRPASEPAPRCPMLGKQ